MECIRQPQRDLLALLSRSVEPASRERPPRLPCGVPGCAGETRHRKRYCLDHLLHMPYAARIAAAWEAREQELQALDAGVVDPDGDLADDLRILIAESGSISGGQAQALGDAMTPTRLAILARGCGFEVFEAKGRWPKIRRPTTKPKPPPPAPLPSLTPEVVDDLVGRAGSIASLARRAGVARTTITRLLRGGSPTARTAARIKKAQADLLRGRT